ncbi:hypothetical protein COT51_01420 [candidate division WWE3 bacterium CG08_land_8_20_14_0_20_41_15]|uniref:PA14 domain-containing protein n=1 Tax=candidate division WWE3 bacterium CG08_land_8_20_14_0_20_41_15 TaxID=1975086 RepID=A0A2H0XC80_UNCKA|nr:MAG: hypothetical protein COT51_01420 [candidate division WWE3 bacterium CG08_land_8_20_14_0_20_41_15]
MPAKKRKVTHRKKRHSSNLLRLFVLFVFSLVALLLSLYSKSTKISKSEAVFLPPVNEISILELKYLPAGPGGTLDSQETGLSFSLSEVRDKINSFSGGLASALMSGTSNIYSTSGPYLNYRILESNEYLIPVPKSTTFKNTASIPYPDNFSMLSNIKDGKSICHYVDQLGVKEVWVWMYHSAKVVPIESNMSMGLSSKNYWNYKTYGDVSNSDKTNDLPTCQRSYTVYEYNYGRGVGEAMENHTHQIESLFSFMDGTVGFIPSVYNANSLSSYTEAQKENMLFRKFTGVGLNGRISNQGCGWTHFPPNARYDYDWNNSLSSNSNCNSWYLGNTAVFISINCASWGCPDSNTGLNFKKWWMQRIPGKENGLNFSGLKIRNWWEFVGDFDKALADGRSLVNWAAEYYQNSEFLGSPTTTKTRSNINFDVGYGRVDPSIPEDNFSVRFKRIVTFDSGNYQFKVLADGGYKVYIDDVLKIDISQTSSVTPNISNFDISAGPHIIKVDYYNRLGKASLKFEYKKGLISVCKLGAVDTVGCNQVGSCRGAYRSCGGDGTWGPCSKVASAEICGDGLDNNCDGVVDDRCPVTTNLTGQVCSSPWTTTTKGCTCVGAARYCNPYYNDGLVTGQRWTRCFPSPENNCQS